MSESSPGLTYGLTRMQRHCLLIIQELTDEQGGVPPSYEEIRLELDLQSRSGVVVLVDALERRGYVSRIRGNPRSLTILKRIDMPEDVEIVGLFDAPAMFSKKSGAE